MNKRKYYSQNGEDCVLWSIFGDSYIGTFVDIGSLDGLRFSNTYSFELAGWSGLCVEAHPKYAGLTKKNRPNSHVIHAAASNENKESVVLFANELGTLSTLDGSMRGYFEAAYPKAFRGYKRIPVPMRTVDSMLEEAGINSVDVVSIDVEGTEMDVLKGFTLRKYKPKILVSEALDLTRVKRQMHYMRISGYHFARKLGNNLFFCRNKKDASIAHNAIITERKKLIHIAHPLKKRK